MGHRREHGLAKFRETRALSTAWLPLPPVNFLFKLCICISAPFALLHCTPAYEQLLSNVFSLRQVLRRRQKTATVFAKVSPECSAAQLDWASIGGVVLGTVSRAPARMVRYLQTAFNCFSSPTLQSLPHPPQKRAWVSRGNLARYQRLY